MLCSQRDVFIHRLPPEKFTNTHNTTSGLNSLEVREFLTMEKSVNDVWKEALQFIQDNVDDQCFNTWFEPIKPVKLQVNIITVQVPSKFFYEYLDDQ